jgi:hypothetical protein
MVEFLIGMVEFALSTPYSRQEAGAGYGKRQKEPRKCGYRKVTKVLFQK